MSAEPSMLSASNTNRLTFRKANRANLLAITAAGVWIVSDTHWRNTNLVSETFFSVGVLMVAIGFASRLWVSTYQAGYKNKHLITVGPYSMCRNPMYFSNLLGGAGACLTTGTITVPILFMLASLLHYRRVIRNEEATLRRHHGDAFDAYRAATPALVPSFKRFSEPEDYLVRTRQLSARIPLALWPIVAVALIYLVQGLHSHGVLPVLFRIV